MTNEERRVQAATRLRELGHAFVAHDLSDAQLDRINGQLDDILATVRSSDTRQRAVPSGNLADFRMAIPTDGRVDRHQLFADSVVSGAANPMGLGAHLWRDDSVAVMDVTLGKAFEGAPGRAHGGIVAALIDETMGLVLAINEKLAFTAQLDITYVAPTPIDQPLVARAWLVREDGRKLSIEATIESDSRVIVKASALFISVDPQKFLKHLADLNR